MPPPQNFSLTDYRVLTMTDLEQNKKINIFHFIHWIVFIFAISLVVAIVLNIPPRSITIEAGPKGGFFDTTALIIKQELRAEGIQVNILNNEETLKIIKNVDDLKSNVDIGFIAHEVPSNKYKNIMSLGSITMDPLFIYVRNDLNITSPKEFKGLKLGISPVNTGARIVTDAVLDLYDINGSNAVFVPLSLMEMSAAIKNGTVDVAFFLQPTTNKVVSSLGESGAAKLMSLDRVEAITKKYGYLHHLTIEPGAFNLGKDLPETPIEMLGVPVTVIAKDTLHPGIVTLISLALKDAFRAPTLVTKRGAFPTMDYERDLDIDQDAEKIYKNGTGYIPPLYKALNFWVAGVLDKILLLLSFVLSVSIVFSFIGFPSPYSIWINTTSERYVVALEGLYKKSQKKPLTSKEIEKIKKIRAFFDEENQAGKKATQLISSIKSLHPDVSLSKESGQT